MNRLQAFIHTLSIQRKWSFATTSIILLSYVFMCALLFYVIYSWLLIGEQQRAARTADDVDAFILQQSINIQNMQQYSGLMKSIIEQDETVRIYNFDGIELIRINDAAKPVSHNFTTEQLQQGQIVVENGQVILYKPVQIGFFQGYMQLVHPLTAMYNVLRYIVITMSILGVLALLLTLVFTSYVVRLLMKPIDALRSAMSAVRDHGFEGAKPITYTPKDEIGELVTIYEQMIEQLERSFTQQQQFVSDASHELRTPIQAIEGHLSLIKRWGKDDRAILEESLDTALLETERMKHLIEELLKLAKTDTHVENVSANIEQVLQQVLEELHFISKPFQVKQQVTGQPHLAYVSEQALGQIFRNIIENSIRYSAEQCIILINIHYADDCIYVQLTDNGYGIAPEHLPHIFERFYRADEARQHIKGSIGLGLSITKMLANKYNIEIDVESEVGKGTAFLLRFSLSCAR